MLFTSSSSFGFISVELASVAYRAHCVDLAVVGGLMLHNNIAAAAS
jgi:hypothetical protein